MITTENGLAEAADALEAMAEGPGQQAARALGEAFALAGADISEALGKAARSGELDFNRMAQAILRDIARVAAEALILRGGQGQSVSASFNFAPGTDESAALSHSAGVASLLARMVQSGGRYL